MLFYNKSKPQPILDILLITTAGAYCSCFYYAFLAGEEHKMTDYILNKVVLKNGDSLDIVKSSTLPIYKFAQFS